MPRSLRQACRVVPVIGLLISHWGVWGISWAEDAAERVSTSPQSAGQSTDTLVVCPTGFREALEPWLRYRRQQGYTLQVIVPETTDAALRDEIRRIAKSGKLKAIVLVGDSSAADRIAKSDDVVPVSPRHVPAHFANAKVNVHFGSQPTIATDNWYADLDDDDIPDVAIGRLPADTIDELAVIVGKILDYETDQNFGEWRRRVNVVAGVGGFGALADSLIESSTKWFLTASIPPSYRVSMTYGSWRSPYCPVPRQFRAHTCERLNEGSLFWVYIGHGLPRRLDSVRVPGGAYPVFSAGDVNRIACRSGAPIAIFLSCYAGAYDLPDDCLGEELLRKEKGPVAVLASSRVALPYGLGVLSSELLTETFVSKRATLGDMLLHAKRQSMQEKPDDARRRMLDAISKAMSPVEATTADERREHLHLVNLLGDPLLRVRQPQRVRIKKPRRAMAGQQIDVDIESPVAGQATVDLIVRRDRLRVRPQPRYKYLTTAAALSEFDSTYRAANDPRFVSQSVLLKAGKSSLTLRIPEDASGSCYVQVFVEGEEGFAVGSSKISIRKPVQQDSAATAESVARP